LIMVIGGGLSATDRRYRTLSSRKLSHGPADQPQPSA
jgi:hypothetical protein